MMTASSETDGYQIRPGTAADLPALAAIERDAAELFREVGYDFCADGPNRGDEELRTALEHGAVFIACARNGRICGFALIWRIDGCAHLLELAVSRRDQGKRLGRRLVDASEAWVRDAGLSEITLTTFRDVPWNAPLYERLGYRVFEPEAWRTGLAAVQHEEAESGFAVEPRVAMRKALVDGG